MESILISNFRLLGYSKDIPYNNFDGIASILHDAKYFVDGFGSRILEYFVGCAKDIVDSPILLWTLYHEVFRQWRRS